MTYQIQTASEKVEIIDSYIEMGYSYEDAYMMWENDFNRGVLPSQTEETLEAEEEIKEVKTEAPKSTTELLIKAAMGRGYSETEATTLAGKVNQMIAEGNYPKAYKLFLARLAS